MCFCVFFSKIFAFLIKDAIEFSVNMNSILKGLTRDTLLQEMSHAHFKEFLL